MSHPAAEALRLPQPQSGRLNNQTSWELRAVRTPINAWKRFEGGRCPRALGTGARPTEKTAEKTYEDVGLGFNPLRGTTNG
jgi:hypothetical protein